MLDHMDAGTALHRLCGIASTAELLDLTSRRRLRTALATGAVVRVARGRFALPDVDEARRRAARVHGVLALRSAAMHHGWPVKWPPQTPEVAVPRGRKNPARRGIRLVWVDRLSLTDVANAPLQTVLMCARALPFDEALAIADSALRAGGITATELQEAADAARGPGAAGLRSVARHADCRAANPFESVLRAIVIDLGLEFEPQHPVDVGDRIIHPDLGDPGRRVALEADSWEWHTGKQAHVNDCVRYNALLIHGWVVLRFAWEHVMLHPEYVRETLTTLRQGPPRRTQVLDPLAWSA